MLPREATRTIKGIFQQCQAGPQIRLQGPRHVLRADEAGFWQLGCT